MRGTLDCTACWMFLPGVFRLLPCVAFLQCRSVCVGTALMADSAQWWLQVPGHSYHGVCAGTALMADSAEWWLQVPGHPPIACIRITVSHLMLHPEQRIHITVSH